MRPGVLKRALVVAGCGVLTVTVSACESTEQESAKIAREGVGAAGPLKLGAANHEVRISDVTLVSGGGRMAIAARVDSSSTRPQANLPVLVKVRGTAGKVLYTNETAGLEASLQHVGLLPAHKSTWWVDDQVLIPQHATGVSVQVGSGSSAQVASGAQLSTASLHTINRGGVSVLSGKLAERGAASHSMAVVSAVALKGGRVVAAGRTTVESVGAGSPFQIFLVGNAAGARIELSTMSAGIKPIGG
jgi:hypothetical protein